MHDDRDHYMLVRGWIVENYAEVRDMDHVQATKRCARDLGIYYESDDHRKSLMMLVGEAFGDVHKLIVDERHAKDAEIRARRIRERLIFEEIYLDSPERPKNNDTRTPAEKRRKAAREAART